MPNYTWKAGQINKNTMICKEAELSDEAQLLRRRNKETIKKLAKMAEEQKKQEKQKKHKKHMKK